MVDSAIEKQNDKLDLMSILVDIRLTNITEIKVLQEVVSFIDTHYKEHKAQIKPPKVAAYILNRQDIPSLYATSFRGYNNQVLEFQNQFGISGYKIREKLIPWAIDKILRSGLSEEQYQDLERAHNNAIDTIEVDDLNFLEILANISLANVSEFQVMKEAASYIYATYPESAAKINLSDVCALILNHRSVCSLYATSAEEYEELRQVYLSEHQFQVNEIIREMAEKVHREETKLAISHDSLSAVNFQRRKKIVNTWNL